jgi:predicted  nucleic acid-binding Zn-ribbon protein
MAKKHANLSSEPATNADLGALKAEIIAAVQDTVKGLATQEALSALTTNVTTIQETVNAIMDTVAETKEDLTAVKEEIQEFRTEVHAGFRRIENLLLAKQEQCLNDLETRMKKLEDALAV